MISRVTSTLTHQPTDLLYDQQNLTSRLTNIFKDAVPDALEALHIINNFLTPIVIPSYHIAVANVHISFRRNFRNLREFHISLVHAT
jgi:hypothetical protein